MKMVMDGLGNRREPLEEISTTAVAVPFRLSNLVSSTNESPMEISNNRDSTIEMSKVVSENDQGSWNSIGDGSMSIAGDTLLDARSLHTPTTTTVDNNIEVTVKSDSKEAEFELDLDRVEVQHQKKICRTQSQRVVDWMRSHDGDLHLFAVGDQKWKML
ncbi:hypothetical protein Ddye_020495 [Dipteronia dyeriana]|uniref:Uncharacterized protein n=1 Tax=Dipteronia dyeriana TaxID=168575 RepID=A0AAD9WX38_9ROSI|nr:hypothetical protein Ddye_020495 [Dipteronia dyeriana]